MIYLTMLGLGLLIGRILTKGEQRAKDLSEASEEMSKTLIKAYTITKQPGYKSCTDEEWELLIKRLQETRKINYLKQYN